MHGYRNNSLFPSLSVPSVGISAPPRSELQVLMVEMLHLAAEVPTLLISPVCFFFPYVACLQKQINSEKDCNFSPNLKGSDLNLRQGHVWCLIVLAVIHQLPLLGSDCF